MSVNKLYLVICVALGAAFITPSSFAAEGGDANENQEFFLIEGQGGAEIKPSIEMDTKETWLDQMIESTKKWAGETYDATKKWAGATKDWTQETYNDASEWFEKNIQSHPMFPDWTTAKEMFNAGKEELSKKVQPAADLAALRYNYESEVTALQGLIPELMRNAQLQIANEIRAANPNLSDEEVRARLLEPEYEVKYKTIVAKELNLKRQGIDKKFEKKIVTYSELYEELEKKLGNSPQKILNAVIVASSSLDDEGLLLNKLFNQIGNDYNPINVVGKKNIQYLPTSEYKSIEGKGNIQEYLNDPEKIAFFVDNKVYKGGISLSVEGTSDADIPAPLVDALIGATPHASFKGWLKSLVDLTPEGQNPRMFLNFFDQKIEITPEAYEKLKAGGVFQFKNDLWMVYVNLENNNSTYTSTGRFSYLLKIDSVWYLPEWETAYNSTSTKPKSENPKPEAKPAPTAIPSEDLGNRAPIYVQSTAQKVEVDGHIHEFALLAQDGSFSYVKEIPKDFKKEGQSFIFVGFLDKVTLHTDIVFDLMSGGNVFPLEKPINFKQGKTNVSTMVDGKKFRVQIQVKSIKVDTKVGTQVDAYYVIFNVTPPKN